MIKHIAKVLVACMVASVATVSSFAAFEAPYPTSVELGTAAPADAEILKGTLIGLESGWGDNPDTGRDKAFDGDIFNPSFFDPLNPGEGYCGIELSEPRALAEIRICPREDQLGRFNGASVYGFNSAYNPDDPYLPADAVLIWESLEAAEEHNFYVIKESEFNKDAVGKEFKYYIYYNEIEHGDVAEVEFWGKAAAAPVEETAATEAPAQETPAEETPAPEAPAQEAPVVEATPVAPATTPTAPATGNMGFAAILAAFGLAAVGTTKAIRRK